MRDATSLFYFASILFCIAASGSAWFRSDQARDAGVHRGTRLVLENDKGSFELAVTADGTCALKAIKKGLGKIDFQVDEMSKVQLVPDVGRIAAGIVSSPDGRLLLAVGNGRDSAVMGMALGGYGFIVGNAEGKKVVTASDGMAGDGRVIIRHPSAEQVVAIRGDRRRSLSIFDGKGAPLSEIRKFPDGFEGLRLFGPLGKTAFGLGWQEDQGKVLLQSPDGKDSASIRVQKGKAPLLSGGR